MPHLDGLDVGWFEAITATALRYFADECVDVAVIEAGMGGSTDATNVVESVVSVITSVTTMHGIFLGDTLAAVAEHKAGIIKPGSAVVSGVTSPEAIAVIRARAQELSCPLLQLGENLRVTRARTSEESSVASFFFSGRRFEDVLIGLPGMQQPTSAALALAAANATFTRLGIPMTVESARQGLAHLPQCYGGTAR